MTVFIVERENIEDLDLVFVLRIYWVGGEIG